MTNTLKQMSGVDISKKKSQVWQMDEKELIDFLINHHPGHIYPLLEKKWSWEVQDEYTRRKWSFYPNVLLKQIESPNLVLTDIDIFCVNNLIATESAALQVKKIKVRSTNARDSVNKGVEADVKEAVRQADLLAQLGFPLVSTLFLIVNDAHETHKGGVIWDALSDKKLDSIFRRLLNAQERYAKSQCLGLYVLLFIENSGQNIGNQGRGGIKRLIDPKLNPISNNYFHSFLDKLLS